MNCNVTINKRTKTAELTPLLTKERIDEFMAKVDEVELEKPILQMSLREFKEASSETYYQRYLSEVYAVNAFGKIKSYDRQMQEIARLVELYSPERTDDEKLASQGVNFPDAITAMVDDVIHYFNLHSFEEGQERTIGDWLVIAKINKAREDYKANLRHIQEEARNGNNNG